MSVQGRKKGCHHTNPPFHLHFINVKSYTNAKYLCKQAYIKKNEQMANYFTWADLEAKVRSHQRLLIFCMMIVFRKRKILNAFWVPSPEPMKILDYVNILKSEVLCQHPPHMNLHALNINIALENIDYFPCLGSPLSNHADIGAEIQHRISLAHLCNCFLAILSVTMALVF